MSAPHGNSWAGRREAIWSALDRPWDLVVVGGGITGAAILREAARLGLRALLVEQRDFAWGASSRSSKLVHGGLRYLKEGKIGITRAAVRERNRLLQEGPGLVDPLGFLLATYRGEHPGRLLDRLGLMLYDLLALQWRHAFHDAGDFRLLAPHIKATGLRGGFHYLDARTDDARLVLRVLKEAVRSGATALNYARVVDLLRRDGQVVGVRVLDTETGRTTEASAKAVINATGAWADRLRSRVDGEPMIRPLRGSHLIIQAWRLPVPQAVAVLHPKDSRPVFFFPWEGVTIVGTTDVDHVAPLDDEPTISRREVDYLLEGVHAFFPALDIRPADVTATYSGVRPVIGSGKRNPSQESRDYIILDEQGLLTLTGGKLTTFRLIARDAIDALRSHIPDLAPADHDAPALDSADDVRPGELGEDLARRLGGWWSNDAATLIQAAGPGELSLIPGTPLLWAELRWAARTEAVVHLEDLLLRRVRVGLLVPDGGADLLPRIRTIVQDELGWHDTRWEYEVEQYLNCWRRAYRLPSRSEPTAAP
ncbi:MAG TPA: glycerol-3-phosphate dehydrogenase/oxidase [Actinobacteria bacterium]|nr:aerobic glycerol-3-phosphate dehydrogenase [bacterium BMS3Bbin01]HDH25360.1 glycerol-3-phosphate dehydrogenase/oxidase [Actinomycetota bacterium]